MLNPDGIHVGDLLDAEVIVAYGFYTDEIQSVITLVNKDDRLPYPTEGGGNYHTFFRNESGHQSESQLHWNIVEAIERYTSEMGMDI